MAFDIYKTVIKTAAAHLKDDPEIMMLVKHDKQWQKQFDKASDARDFDALDEFDREMRKHRDWLNKQIYQKLLQSEPFQISLMQDIMESCVDEDGIADELAEHLPKEQPCT